MLLIDENDWPLALVRCEAPIVALDIDLFRTRFQSWLRRERRFAVLSVQPAPAAAADAPLFAQRWTQPLCGRLRRHCAGIACLIPDAAASADPAREYARRLQRQLTCPVHAFFDSDCALIWLRAQLGAPAANAARNGPRAVVAHRS